MLYLEQMHETAQNRTNEREQARHTNHRHRTPNPDRRSHHASRTGTEEPTQADEHTDGTQTPPTGAKAPQQKIVKNCEKVVDNGGGVVYIIITAGNR